MDWTAYDGGRRLRRKRLAAAAGGEEIGCSLCELPAGNRSWPYHYHTGNEGALGCDGERSVHGYYRRSDDVDSWADEPDSTG